MYDPKILTAVLTFFEQTQAVNDKDELQAQFEAEFHAFRQSKRGVWDLPGDTVSVRFTQNNIKQDGSGSGTVLAIAKIKERDDHPILSVMVTAGKNYVRLMNSSYIDKISHSSQHATLEKPRGSANYSNILKHTLDGIPNDAAHVQELFEQHTEHSFEDNYYRIYQQTGQIKGNKARFVPAPDFAERIGDIFARSQQFCASEAFVALEADLNARVQRDPAAISAAGTRIVNAKTRGEVIEYLISADDTPERAAVSAKLARHEQPTVTNPHALADFSTQIGDLAIGVDIKTKALYLHSQPKGFNIDDMLTYLAKSNTVFLFYWVGIEQDGALKLKLLPVFERNMLAQARVITLWSGIGQRGHVQFDGENVQRLLADDNYTPQHMSLKEVTAIVKGWVALP